MTALPVKRLNTKGTSMCEGVCKGVQCKPHVVTIEHNANYHSDPFSHIPPTFLKVLMPLP